MNSGRFRLLADGADCDLPRFSPAPNHASNFWGCAGSGPACPTLVQAEHHPSSMCECHCCRRRCAWAPSPFCTEVARGGVIGAMHLSLCHVAVSVACDARNGVLKVLHHRSHVRSTTGKRPSLCHPAGGGSCAASCSASALLRGMAAAAAHCRGCSA